MRMRAFLRQAARATAPCGVLAFWIGMLTAGRGYPTEYDWRYITMSSLVYAERNPDGFLSARAGIALCGLAGLWWTAGLLRSGPPLRAQRLFGIRTLGLGYLCMMCCALLPERLAPIPKAHELLALAAFIGICAGMVLVTFVAVGEGGRLCRLPTGERRLYAAILVGIPLAPILLAVLAQAYVTRELPALPWVNLGWRARGVPLCLSFAFWEWVTCAVLSVYMMVLSLSNRAGMAPAASAKMI
jgi:hypothetical protein